MAKIRWFLVCGLMVGALVAQARPRPPATPTVLATADDQEILGGLLLSGGDVLYGGGHTVTRPPDAGPPAFEMVGVLRSVPAGGGAVTELWTGNGEVDDIAPVTDGLLFLAYDFFSRTGHLNRLAADGTVTELSSWFSHGSSHSLTTHADVAYWTHSAGAGSFVKSTTADGTTVTLADSSTIGSSADNILFKAGVLYFVSSQAQRTVYGVPADGGAAPTAFYAAPQIDSLAGVPAEPILIAGAGTSVVAIDVRRHRSRTIFSGANTVSTVAADEDAAYFGTTDSATGAGAIARIAHRGGPAVVLATGTFTPRSMAVDATNVYWLDATARTVLKAPK